MTVERERYRATYRFGPIERRGIAGGLRAGQIVVLGSACVFGVAAFRRLPNLGGLALALTAIGIACAGTWGSVAGRTLDEWAPVVLRWFARSRRYRSPAPMAGIRIHLGTRRLQHETKLPAPIDRVELVGMPLADDRTLGVFIDRQNGTYTAVTSVRVRSFGLLAAAEQERRLDRWGRTLASLARDGGPVRRIQLIERTLPHDEDQLQRWLDASGDPAVEPTESIRRSYEGLIRSAADVTHDHEVLLALQVDPRRARGGDRQLSRDELGCQLVLREIRTLAERLEASDAGVTGLLSVAQCALTMRLAFEPQLRAHLSRLRVTRPQQLGPTAAHADWDRYRADGAVHRSYWIAQWPRLDVGPAFLAPLFLSPSAVRSFSVVVEPVPPARARSAAEAAVTSDEGDEQLRQERGFRTSARRRKQQAATQRREAELADGHEELRFAAFLTVSGTDDADLDAACVEMQQAAQQAYLDLQPMWGQQELGFVCGALPLCYGLSRAGLFDR